MPRTNVFSNVGVFSLSNHRKVKRPQKSTTIISLERPLFIYFKVFGWHEIMIEKHFTSLEVWEKAMSHAERWLLLLHLTLAQQLNGLFRT